MVSLLADEKDVNYVFLKKKQLKTSSESVNTPAAFQKPKFSLKVAEIADRKSIQFP